MRGRGCRRAHPPPQETKEEGLRWSSPDKEAAGVWTSGDKGWLGHVGVGFGGELEDDRDRGKIEASGGVAGAANPKRGLGRRGCATGVPRAGRVGETARPRGPRLRTW